MTQSTNPAEVLGNRHFCQYAAILSVAMSPKWRQKHSEVPSARGTLERLLRLVKTAAKSSKAKQQFLTEFLGMYLAIVEVDQNLLHCKEDMDWLVGVVDDGGIDMAMIFSMLFAIACAPRRWYSAEQVAEFTGKTAGTWKNKAANDHFVGAAKVGKTWMFSDLALHAYKVKVPLSTGIEDTEEKEF